MRRVARFVFAFVLQHELIMTSRFKPAHSHLAQLRCSGKGLIPAQVPWSRAIALLHPSAICECHCAIRRDRGRGGSVRDGENPTCAANWVLLSPRPAPGPSSRFARHFHDRRRGIRPDLSHRVLQLELVREPGLSRRSIQWFSAHSRVKLIYSCRTTLRRESLT